MSAVRVKTANEAKAKTDVERNTYTLGTFICYQKSKKSLIGPKMIIFIYIIFFFFSLCHKPPDIINGHELDMSIFLQDIVVQKKYLYTFGTKKSGRMKSRPTQM
jgi:hypothetical protein